MPETHHKVIKTVDRRKGEVIDLGVVETHHIHHEHKHNPNKKHRRIVKRESTSTETEVVETHLARKRTVKKIVQQVS
jgi:hypothetical protein